MMLLGDRLRKLRIASGMTQQDVADALGLERSTYSNYETNSTKPTVENLCALARIFCTTPDVLTNYSSAGVGGPPPVSPMPDADGLKIDADRLSRLTRDEKHLVLLYRMCDDKDGVLAYLAAKIEKPNQST
ncbi:MAG: helix-turn-helix domain-containing protein [Clostridia bacterium]|nr:helix-turn-helix domain-containing protein [Clostridia bacterium]